MKRLLLIIAALALLLSLILRKNLSSALGDYMALYSISIAYVFLFGLFYSVKGNVFINYMAPFGALTLIYMLFWHPENYIGLWHFVTGNMLGLFFSMIIAQLLVLLYRQAKG